MQRFNFDSESDRYATVHGLRIAAERYDEHAIELDDDLLHVRLRDQFKRQAAEARRLADQIEEDGGQ